VDARAAIATAAAGDHRCRAYNRAMAADGARMWILTGSPDDDTATLGHGFT
jgi:hypothetical protein